MQALTPTAALAKQMNFLVEIKSQIDAADNACDILDLLAVGIYNIDAEEAVSQGVKQPSDKAKKQSVDAIASLDKLTSTSNNLSGNARGLEWSSWMLSNGKYGGFAKSMGGVANTAGKIGMVGEAAGGAAKTVQSIGQIGKGLGIGFGSGKNKPCNKVPKKDIQLGEHVAATSTSKQSVKQVASQNSNAGTSAPPPSAANSTEVIINHINDDQLSSLSSALRKTSGISSVNDDNFTNNTATLAISHNLESVGQLIEKIKASTKINLKLLSRSPKNAILDVVK